MDETVVVNPDDFGTKEFDPAGFASFVVSGMVIDFGYDAIKKGIGTALPAPIKLLYATASGMVSYGTAEALNGSEVNNPNALFTLAAGTVVTLAAGSGWGLAAVLAIDQLTKIPPTAADGVTIYAAEGSFGLEFQSGAADKELTRCFPAHTRIQTSRTTSTAISALRIGDVVAAFDARADKGRGALVPRRVTRLYRNSTTDWIRLRRPRGTAREVITTPGHHFLDELGGFPTTPDMTRTGSAP